MIHIDGSYREGGGQIIRTALALSALTRQSFRAEKIRYNRRTPGLKRQHLCCIEALKKLMSAKVTGAEPGSLRIDFIPDQIVPGTFNLDIGTAGSIPLLLQSILLPTMFADGTIKFTLTGGTDTRWSIPIDFFIHVILPYFNRFADIRLERKRRGYFPKGGGTVELIVQPVFHLNDFKNLKELSAHIQSTATGLALSNKRSIQQIRGISSASGILKKANVAERQVQGAMQKIGNAYRVDIETEYEQTASVGTVITLWTEAQEGNGVMGGDALGERGRRAEDVGAEAAAKLLAVLNSNAVVDCHLADNLIPLLALVGGSIKTREITEHMRSNMYVCEKFMEKRFAIDANSGQITVDE